MALAEADTHGLYVDAAGNPSDEFAAKAAGTLFCARTFTPIAYKTTLKRSA
jgi:hypothetical protein